MFRQIVGLLAKSRLLLILLWLSSQMTIGLAFIDGLYCGRENCYDGMSDVFISKTHLCDV